MALTRLDFHNITLTDIEELRENEVAEGLLLDYKAEPYGRSEADKKEFLKDVSSFANTAGGHLLVGVAEAGGVPTQIAGVEGDLDAEMLRLESLLRDRIEPRIVGIRMVLVPIGDNRRVLVIRVPRSWNPPHAVLQNASRLIFARNSAGVHEASIDEMRGMFTSGAREWELAKSFQSERMAVVHNGAGPLYNIQQDGRILLHIVPFSALVSQGTAELERLDPSELVPIWCSGCDSGYNVDGYWTKSGQAGAKCGYLQFFRNGIIETAAGDIRTSSERGPYFLVQSFEDQVATKTERYLNSMKRADVAMPAYIMASGVRMHGTYVFFDPYDKFREAQPLSGNVVFPAVRIDEYTDLSEYRQSLKPVRCRMECRRVRALAKLWS
jgi:Putative DNA-binding domain